MSARDRALVPGPNFAAPESLVNRAFENLRCASEHLPCWDRQPTAAEANAAKSMAIARLRRFRLQSPGALRLAEHLERCCPTAPCRLGPCPPCQLVFQEYVVVQSANQMPT